MEVQSVFTSDVIKTLLIIASCGVLFIILKYLYNLLYLYPREIRSLSDDLGYEETACINLIIRQIRCIDMQIFSNPIWKKIQQNLIDNHARMMLEVHYKDVRNFLLAREDFDKKYVQVIYERNEKKIENVYNKFPFIDLDIKNVFSQSIITTYEKFSKAWYRLISESEQIMRYGKPIHFPNFTLGRVRVGNIPIPSFNNIDGDIIYFFPTFVVILKRDCFMTFYSIEDISIELSGEDIKFIPQKAPNDSIYLGESWLFSNKDGSMDRRYCENQRYVHYKVTSILICGISELFSFQASNYELSSFMRTHFINLKKASIETSDKTDLEVEDEGRVQQYSIDQLGIKVPVPKSNVPNTKKNNNKSSIYPIFELDKADPLFVEVAYWVLSNRIVSQSSIQKHFNIGFDRATQIIDDLEVAGIISSSTTTSPIKEIEFTIENFNVWLKYQQSMNSEAEVASMSNKGDKKSLRRSKHYVGERHPTQPWIWTEYAPGKFDWRKDRSKFPK